MTAKELISCQSSKWYVNNKKCSSFLNPISQYLKAIPASHTLQSTEKGEAQTNQHNSIVSCIVDSNINQKHDQPTYCYSRPSGSHLMLHVHHLSLPLACTISILVKQMEIKAFCFYLYFTQHSNYVLIRVVHKLRVLF